jgi:hypothetical protein
MSTLQELTNAMRELEGLMADPDIPTEAIEDTLSGIPLGEKLDACAAKLGQWEGMAATCKAEQDRLAKRRKALENRVNRLRSYMAFCLGGLNDPRVETDLHIFNLQDPQERLMVDVDSPGELDARYRKVSVSVDTARLKADLKDGKEVEGAHLERGAPFLVIR